MSYPITITEWISESKDLSDDDKKELCGAISSRGKNKNTIKNTAPATSKIGRFAWQAIMAAIAPVRFSVYAIMGASTDQRALFDRLELWARANRIPLIVFGTRPYQFNLWDHHYDRARAVALLLAYRADHYERGASYERELVRQDLIALRDQASDDEHDEHDEHRDDEKQSSLKF